MVNLDLRAFVVTDNKYLYQTFFNVCKNKNIKLDYYCSNDSDNIFANELSAGTIKKISVKEDYNFLLKNYYMGFSCHSKQIFPKQLVNKIVCVNIHPGLNPYNRGWYPQVFSIINKKPIGVTVHLMDEKIDHGAIIYQEELTISENETSLQVYERLLKLEKDIIEKNIDNILSQNYESFFPENNGNYNSIKDFQKLCQIDLNEKLTFKEAIDRLRALLHQPFKNAYFIDSNNNKIYLRLELLKETIEQ
ncbi:MAG: dTDP-4-amino-4,6-dideoxyglucose formyltransferase [Candidatus Gastranaerophilales bacterium]|nr:dTDP-4-amino-4,6-dideoxyglucose formyltransferase [Candidatus Gastranaerophilales bacterium]